MYSGRQRGPDLHVQQERVAVENPWSSTVTLLLMDSRSLANTGSLNLETMVNLWLQMASERATAGGGGTAVARRRWRRRCGTPAVEAPLWHASGGGAAGTCRR